MEISLQQETAWRANQIASMDHVTQKYTHYGTQASFWSPVSCYC